MEGSKRNYYLKVLNLSREFLKVFILYTVATNWLKMFFVYVMFNYKPIYLAVSHGRCDMERHLDIKGCHVVHHPFILQRQRVFFFLEQKKCI